MLLRLLSFVVPAVFVLSLAGCKPSEPVYHISGTITFQGKAIPRGQIYFDPDGPGAVQGAADVVDGKYDTRTSDMPIRGGKYVVRVQGYDGVGGPEKPWGNALFNEFTTTKDFEEKDQVFDLEVPVTE